MDENDNVNENDNQAPRCMFFNDDEVINVIVNVIVKKKYMHVPRVVHACTFWGTRLYRNGLIYKAF